MATDSGQIIRKVVAFFRFQISVANFVQSSVRHSERVIISPPTPSCRRAKTISGKFGITCEVHVV